MSVVWFSINFVILPYIVESHIRAVDSHNGTDTFLDTELRFTGDIMGVVVLADPLDACTNISGPPPELLNTSINCFVLIDGSSCLLEEKVQYAWAANFSAVLIYKISSNVAVLWENRFTLFRIFSRYNITTVLISSNSGERIIKRYLYTVDPGSRIFILYNQPTIITAILRLFAIVAGIFVLLVLFFLMIKCLQQRRLRNRYRLSSRHLKHLDTMKYRSGNPYDTCAICLEDYKEKDKLRVLPCSHAYHCKCIDPWLTNNRRTCPVCKQKVRLPGVHDDDDDDDENSGSDTEGRAETAPLIRGSHVRTGHGTFTDGMSISPVAGHSNILRISSGETTSRDVPSDALDETSEEVVAFRLSMSAPDDLADSATGHAVTVPCSSPNSKGELSELLHDADAVNNNSHGSNVSGDTKTENKKIYAI